MALWGNKNPFSQNSVCISCGSAACSGQCLANQAIAPIQSIAPDQWLLDMQRQQLQAMQQMLGAPPRIFGLEAPVKRKPLPEESVLCATGGLIGWRLWRVPCFGDTLLSINGEEWKPRTAIRAICKKGATSCRGSNCECGIYAWKKAEHVEINEDGYSCLKGEVWLWGKIIEHEKGYRAEYAYPKAFSPSGDAERLAAIYGVKVINQQQA